MRVKNLIYIAISSGCKEEYIEQPQTMLKERLNTNRQHIRQPELQQIDVQRHIRTCGGGNFKIMPVFAVWQDNNILRESYETYFIEKLKPEHLQKLSFEEDFRTGGFCKKSQYFLQCSQKYILSMRFNICA